MAKEKRNVKVVYGGDIRRAFLLVDEETNLYSELEALIGKLFGAAATEETKIRYKDEDGDMILVCSTEELADAFSQAKAEGKTLKLFVEKAKPEPKKTSEEKSATATAPPATAPPKEQPAGQPSKEQPKSSPFDDWQEAKDQRRQARHEKKKHGHYWRDQARAKREEARCEFMEEIKAFLSDAKVVAAVQVSLPTVAGMLLKGQHINAILDTILNSQPALKNHPLVERLLPLIRFATGFIPSDTIGPILLDVVLDLQGLIKDGKIEIPIQRLIKRIIGSIKRAARRATPDVHFGVTCDKCEGESPIVGTRWKKINENYDLCSAHYEALDAEEKKLFEEVAPHGWRPPCAFGIPGFHPGPFLNLMNMMGGFGGGRGFGGFGGGGGCGGGFGQPWGPPGAGGWRRHGHPRGPQGPPYGPPHGPHHGPHHRGGPHHHRRGQHGGRDHRRRGETNRKPSPPNGDDSAEGF
mmetsp:Transcript_2991/g.5813  ORF Transcript_2991/g.5813 Transcript_2991/m.5813 type:complete len:466 (-) Transcript_2991:857-2254(-)